MTFHQAPPLLVRGTLWHGAVVIADLLGAIVIVLCVPFAILAIGTPLVLLVRFLLWIAGWL